jgi:outer membrane protein TolC
MNHLRRVSLALSAVVLSACTTVGPDYVRPDSPLGPDWYEADRARYETKVEQQVLWWQALGDPVLNELIDLAHRQNNSLKIAGLRVLESRAQLGIALGNRYPQAQAVAGDATVLQASKNAANTAAGDLEFTQFNIGVGASWANSGAVSRPPTPRTWHRLPVTTRS